MFVVLSHDRRRILHFNVTEHPTAAWTAQQITEAFPGDERIPRFLHRDRDSIYGDVVRQRIDAIGMKEVVSAKQSPWQNPYAERVIGSIRRECTDHLIPLDESHLCKILGEYVTYYNTARCHQSLDGNAPEPRSVADGDGSVYAIPHLGGLHHECLPKTHPTPDSAPHQRDFDSTAREHLAPPKAARDAPPCTSFCTS